MRIEEVRLQCIDRARSMYPDADPDEMIRVAETFSRFVIEGNALVVESDGAARGARCPGVSAYSRDAEPFTDAEVNRIVCGLTL